MINTEKGKRAGRVFIAKHLTEKNVTFIMSYLSLAPHTIEEHTYNWELIGTSPMFDALDDMETVPTYDIVHHRPDAKFGYIELKRIASGNRK